MARQLRDRYPHAHSARSALSLDRRQFLRGLTLGGASTLVPVPASAADDALRQAIGQMVLIGFKGSKPDAPSARALAEWVRNGRVGGVFFVKDNVGSRQDVARLVQLFAQGSELPPLIAIDHEGGWVQRLKQKHGFVKLPKAHRVAQTMTPDQAQILYAGAAKDLAALGFNLNLAPVVDFHDPDNPPIGQQGRAYSSDPVLIAAYASAFVDAFAAHGVACAIKHFPGHGRSRDDSHKSLPDIAKTWKEEELLPFASMIASGKAQIIMGGHLQLGDGPTTLSPATTTGLLRQKLGYGGVIMTDDLDMAAVRSTVSRRDAVIRAISAGNDLIMIQNVVAADRQLADDIANWVTAAIGNGEIDAIAVLASGERVRRLRQSLKRSS